MTATLKFCLFALITAFGLPFSTAQANEQPSPRQRSSESVDAAGDGWKGAGFRLGVGYRFDLRWSTDYPPNLEAHGFVIRPHYRLNRNWGLGVNLSYAIAGQTFSGLGWSLALETTFWPMEGLSFTLGAGYGGLMVDCRKTGLCPHTVSTDWAGVPLTQDRPLSADEQLGACTGGGPVGILRVDYQWVLGPMFATGPFIQTHLQSNRCEYEAGGVSPDTGESLHYYDWWTFAGTSAGWWLTWR